MDVSAPSTLQQAHSHNDYEQKCPLQDALSLGFASVEADLWYENNEIQVAHDRKNFAGTLKNLYLDPLQKRVTEKGSVYGDGVEFLLWVELKDPAPELRTALHELLDDYSMLSTFSETGPTLSAVTVVVTGDEELKKAFIAERSLAHATRDSHDPESEDPSVTWCSLELDSHGPEISIPQTLLKTFVQKTHNKNRRLRFFGAPDHPGVWNTMKKAGVDLISTDNINGLSRFLRP